jgi:hypothetical protein
MEIKKNTFSTLVLEFFSHQLQTVGNCNSKIDFPYCAGGGWGSSGFFQPQAVALVMPMKQ